MLTPRRFTEIAVHYPRLNIAIVGDFCLDRYLEIDPAREEMSIETGLPVHNVVRVRAQPGGAGTILNNLVALGVGKIHPLGFCGDDGEGYELLRALSELPGVCVKSFLRTPLRRTFTYCKPLLVQAGAPPVELSRLDSKNWTATPADVEDELIRRLSDLVPMLDALIVLDQVGIADTGVVTRRVLDAVQRVTLQRPGLWILADSRRGLRNFPQVCFKMNRAELAALLDVPNVGALCSVQEQAKELASRHGRHVFITLAEEGMVAAAPGGAVEHVPALPLRGPIDIVGAGDCVTANLTAALAAGALLPEALQIASTAASIVIHQVGTTGTASVGGIHELLEVSRGAGF